MKKRGLGKGLQALLPENFETEEDIVLLNITQIKENPWQPREKIEEDEDFLSLVNSIKAKGILQPIIVREKDRDYELVAGWRRYEAAKKAGLKTIPAIIKKLSDREVLEIALIENLQRKNLNPIEEARAYKTLIDEFKLTQEEISDIVGKSRSTVANILRLLNLHPFVQDMLKKGKITEGHARVLLRIEDLQKQVEVCKMIIEKKLTTSQIEKLIKAKQPKKVKKGEEVSQKFSEFISGKIGYSVKVKFKRGGKIDLIINFKDKEELGEFLKKLGFEDKEGILS